MLPVTSPQIYLGIDAGATKTSLLLRSKDGMISFSAEGPGANVQRQGTEDVTRTTGELIKHAIGRVGVTHIAGICAGIAGAGRAQEQVDLKKALLEYLASELPAEAAPTDSALHVVHDGIVALEGAFAGESGVIVIAGSGSVVFGRTEDNRVHRAGGWGYLLGDDGSGHSMGIELLRAVAASMEGGPHTDLAERLSGTSGIRSVADIIRSLYQERMEVQQLAPVLLDAAGAGDAVALAIVEDQTMRLARNVSRMCRRIDTASDRRIAIVGGLGRSPLYLDTFARNISTELPDWTIVPPAFSPVEGALLLAQNPARIPAMKP